jgi:molybdate transport system substrate-binding protein
MVKAGFWRGACASVFALTLACAAHADDLVVSAASSLTNAFQGVAKAYQASHPETHVVLNFASSDTLMRQIANGAPSDVYASADQLAMDRAQAQGMLAAGTRSNFAANQLVLIVPAGSRARVRTLKDLLGDGFKRVAWGNPVSVPVGRYTQRVLADAELDKALQSRAWITWPAMRSTPALSTPPMRPSPGTRSMSRCACPRPPRSPIRSP